MKDVSSPRFDQVTPKEDNLFIVFIFPCGTNCMYLKNHPKHLFISLSPIPSLLFFSNCRDKQLSTSLKVFLRKLIFQKNVALSKRLIVAKITRIKKNDSEKTIQLYRYEKESPHQYHDLE